MNFYFISLSLFPGFSRFSGMSERGTELIKY